jgi:Arginase family
VTAGDGIENLTEPPQQAAAPYRRPVLRPRPAGGEDNGRADVADLDAAVLPDEPLYVHLDLDVTDPAGIPGLRYPESDGPDSTEVSRALRTLATGRVAAVDVACTWHPGQDAAGSR